MAKKITINEALTWTKTLQERHAELVGLRNENSAVRTSYRGLKGDTPDKVEPVYDVVSLDRLISQVAAERRRLDAAIKATNARVRVHGYEMDEAVLGELMPAVGVSSVPPKPKA